MDESLCKSLNYICMISSFVGVIEKCTCICTGLPQSGKSQGKTIGKFFQGQEKDRENLSSCQRQ